MCSHMMEFHTIRGKGQWDHSTTLPHSQWKEGRAHRNPQNWRNAGEILTPSGFDIFFKVIFATVRAVWSPSLLRDFGRLGAIPPQYHYSEDLWRWCAIYHIIIVPFVMFLPTIFP